MARYDVHRLQGLGDGYVVNVQSDFLDTLHTRVVIPLIRVGGEAQPVRDLQPVVEIFGESYILATQLVSAVSVRSLQRRVVSLASERDAITRALDTLLIGF